MEKRFEITKYDCLIDNKEKIYVCDFCDLAKSPKVIVDLLNKQNDEITELTSRIDLLKSEKENLTRSLEEAGEKIKELEDGIKMLKGIKRYDIGELLTENIKLKKQLSNEIKSHDLCIDSFNEECEKLRKQIKFESDARKRFKQSQNQKAIECLETLRKFINENTYYWEEERFADQINDFIDNQIAELRGEK